MNNFSYIKTTWDLASDIKEEYLSYLAGFPDGFWDNNVYGSTPYLIKNGAAAMGIYAIGKYWQGQPLLTAFYLRKPFYRYAEQIFDEIIARHKAEYAFPPSCDEIFTSLSFSKCKDNQGRFDIQSYFFSERITDGIRAPEYGFDCISKLSEADYPRMNRLTNNEWLEEMGKPNAEFYMLSSEKAILGFGSMLRHKLNPRVVDIGNFVLPEHRRKGVGRSIILHLTDIAVKHGNKVTVGCWYYNKNSLSTLQSSGWITPSRMFCISFLPNTSEGGKKQ